MGRRKRGPFLFSFRSTEDVTGSPRFSPVGEEHRFVIHRERRREDRGRARRGEIGCQDERPIIATRNFLDLTGRIPREERRWRDRREERGSATSPRNIPDPVLLGATEKLVGQPADVLPDARSYESFIFSCLSALSPRGFH